MIRQFGYIFLRIFIGLLISIPATSDTYNRELTKIVPFETLLAMTPAVREKYLKEIQSLLVDLEAMQPRREDYFTQNIDQQRSQIVFFLNYFMNAANAELTDDQSDPHKYTKLAHGYYMKSAGTCVNGDQSNTYDIERGLPIGNEQYCRLTANPSTSCKPGFVPVDQQPDGTFYCATADSFKALSAKAQAKATTAVVPRSDSIALFRKYNVDAAAKDLPPGSNTLGTYGIGDCKSDPKLALTDKMGWNLLGVTYCRYNKPAGYFCPKGFVAIDQQPNGTFYCATAQSINELKKFKNSANILDGMKALSPSEKVAKKLASQSADTSRGADAFTHKFPDSVYSELRELDKSLSTDSVAQGVASSDNSGKLANPAKGFSTKPSKPRAPAQSQTAPPAPATPPATAPAKAATPAAPSSAASTASAPVTAPSKPKAAPMPPLSKTDSLAACNKPPESLDEAQCNDVSRVAGKKFFYHTHADDNKSPCIFSGFFSEYQNGTPEKGKCKATVDFQYKPGDNIEETTYKCQNKDQVLCNPLVFGIKNNQGICVSKSDTATKDCDTASQGSKALVLNPNTMLAAKWDQFADSFNKYCHSDQVTRSFFCRECFFMEKKLYEINLNYVAKVAQPNISCGELKTFKVTLAAPKLTPPTTPTSDPGKPGAK
jgi:hypothetical protein